MIRLLVDLLQELLLLLAQRLHRPQSKFELLCNQGGSAVNHGYRTRQKRWKVAYHHFGMFLFDLVRDATNPL